MTTDAKTPPTADRPMGGRPKRRTSCPCCWTTPCPFSSHGCLRCCAYGSDDQRRRRAETLAKIIDGQMNALRDLHNLRLEMHSLRERVTAAEGERGA